MPRKRKKISKTTMKKLDTKKTKIDQSSSANQSMTKRRKNTSETKNMKIDESSSANQETPTTSQDTKKNDLMDTGAHDFKDIRYLPAFVDKTMLIDILMQKKYSRVLLIAPRRFGKTVNLSMMKRFLEVLPDKEAVTENRNLFIGTKIEEKCPDIINSHCGKYPVILLDFKCSGSRVFSFGDVLEFLREVVHDAYKRHSYLQSSDKLNDSETTDIKEWCDNRTYESIAATSSKIESGLKNLAEYLAKHFGQKVIVLVDEYDCVCSNSIIYIADIKEEEKLPDGRSHRKAADEIQDIIALCMGAIGCLLKSNDNVVRGVLTGISYLATMGISALINVEVFRFQGTNDFSKFYGITLEELWELLSRKAVSMESNYEEMKQNYNGYRGNTLSIWSVMHYLNDRGKPEDKNYWRNSGGVAYFDETFKLRAIRDVVSKLLSNISNEVEIEYLSKIEYKDIKELKDILNTENRDVVNVNVFLNFLLEQGYLKRTNLNMLDDKIKVKIPNLEIKSEFRQKLLHFYCGSDCNLDLSKAKKCASLFDKFTISDEDNENLLKEISGLMNEIFNRITLSFQNEATLHHIIFVIIFFCSNFKCFSELRVIEDKDSSRLDIMMLNWILGIAIIIELKCKKTAIEGLKQIIKNKYFDAFKNVKYNPDKLKINYYLLVGLNMDANKKITLCALFNSKTLKKCVHY